MNENATCKPEQTEVEVDSGKKGPKLEEYKPSPAAILRQTDIHAGAIPVEQDPSRHQLFWPEGDPNPFERYVMNSVAPHSWMPSIFNTGEYRLPAAHGTPLMAAYNLLAFHTYGRRAIHAIPPDAKLIRNEAVRSAMPGPLPGFFLPPRCEWPGREEPSEFAYKCPDITTSGYTTVQNNPLTSLGNHTSVQTSPNGSQGIRLVSEDVSALSSEYTKKRKAEDVTIPHHFTFDGGIPLSTEQDENWLSPCHHFFRLHCVELFCATRDDIIGRKHNKEVQVGQAGIRCVYCSKLSYKERTPRSFCFPSSTTRIYQSVTVMLHYHFGSCSCVPEEVKNTFKSLKGKARQGANDAKKFWIKSAKDLGLVDTEKGMFFQNDYGFGNKKRHVESFAQDQQSQQEKEGNENVVVYEDEDKELISDYLFEIMKQVKIIHLTPAEQIGSRRRLNVGHAGLGCRHCVHRGGLGRVFPSSPKKLDANMETIHDHLMRCSLCPPSVKERIKNFSASYTAKDPGSIMNKERFYYIIWSRMNDVGAI